MLQNKDNVLVSECPKLLDMPFATLRVVSDFKDDALHNCTCKDFQTAASANLPNVTILFVRMLEYIL